MATRARIPLSRERILDTALSLVDEGGLDSLTMRKLGQTLGVEAMSLYNHVANKDDVVRGMLQRVAEEIEPPSPEAEWDVAIRASAISAHEALKRHPWACTLMMSPRYIVPERIVYMEALLRRLRDAGFSADATYHAYHQLDAHIFGFSLWQVGHAVSAADLPSDFQNSAALMDWVTQQFPADAYPRFSEHVNQHMTEGPHQDVSSFDLTLDMILDGLKQTVRDTRVAAPSKS